jgi:transposase
LLLAGLIRTRTRITSQRSITAGRCSQPRPFRPQRRTTAGPWIGLGGFGEIDVVAVESTGSYAAALVRYLREHDVRVVEVNRPQSHTRRRIGKSDPIDAEMAARLFQAGKAKAVPKQTDGIVESIRLLRAARHSAVKSRRAAIVQLRDSGPRTVRLREC